MSNDKDSLSLQYDDFDAVKYIKEHLPQELKGKISDDQINYVIDIIYDFYEEKGYMDAQTDESTAIEIDEDDIIDYVCKSVQKDKVFTLTLDEVTFIVQGELAYCDSIGLFE